MAEFFGDLERLAADLYPYRWAIAAGLVIALAAIAAYAYRRGWHLLLWRYRLPAAIVGVPALVVFGFVAYELGSPLFTNVTVEEEFPLAFQAIVPPDMDREEVEEVMAEAAAVDQQVMEPMPTAMGEPVHPTGAGNLSAHRSAPSPSPGAHDRARRTRADGRPGAIARPRRPRPRRPSRRSPRRHRPSPRPRPRRPRRRLPRPLLPRPRRRPPRPRPPRRPLPTPSPTPEPPAGPVRVKVGEFRDQDSFHRGSGQAIIYRGTDGSHLLRLENLNVTNGPDLRVLVSPHPDPRTRDDLNARGYVELARLKGNRGNQNYFIPDTVDVSTVNSVIIYCRPFHVIFSVAPLRDADQ